MRRFIPGYAVRGRYVDRYEVPFQELLPLKLKTNVSAKGESKGGAYCVQEMSVFLACLKKNEFQDKLCGDEFASFQKCVTLHETAMKNKEDAARRGVLAPGERKLSQHQISTLLKQYPS